MVTRDQALNWIQGGWKTSPYVRTINGKTGIDVDGVWGFQCRDLVNAYIDFLGLVVHGGNAIDLWTVALPAQLVRIRNSATFVPQPCDILLYGAPLGYDPDTKQYLGHTELCAPGDSLNQVTALAQNYLNPSLEIGSPPAIVKHDYRGFLGVLRPAFDSQPQGGNVMDKDDAIAYYWNTLHRQYPGQVSDAEINGLIGKKLSEVAAAERGSKEWLTQNYYVLVGPGLITQLNQKIAQLEASPTQQQILDLKNESAAIADTIAKLGGQ